MITLSKLIPIIFLSVGVFLLMQIIIPLISFQLLWFGQKYNNVALVSPTLSNTQVLGVSVENRDNFPIFLSDMKRETAAPYSRFSITIPKIGIEGESVWVDSNDLTSGLAHLPGSSLPGERGNAFISGHSSLSRFFTFKNAAFASLPKIKKGDEIEVSANGAKFRYEVVDIKLIDPKDISVINPPEKLGRYITLMTCVPPLNFKRLVVLGKMI